MFFCVGIGVMLATLFGSLLTKNMSADTMSQWGWRIPFIVGALLSIVVLYLRGQMNESHVYQQERDNRASTPERSESAKSHNDWSRAKIIRHSVGIFLYQAGTTLPYYIWTSFVAVFAITQRGMDPGAAFTASIGAQIINIVLVPVAGWLSDRIGRKPVTLFYYLATAALTIPLMAAITDNPWTLFMAQAIMLSISACIGGTQPAIIAERIPTRYRARVMGTAMPLAVALFGGTAPYLTSWCYSHDIGWMFNVYVITVCLISACVVASWRETKGIELSQVN